MKLYLTAALLYLALYANAQEDVNPDFTKAISLQRNEAFDSAIVYYEKALRSNDLDPYNEFVANYYCGLLLYYVQFELATSAKHLKKALETDYAERSDYGTLAWIYLLMDSSDQCIKYSNIAIEADAFNRVGYVNRAHAYLLKNSIETNFYYHTALEFIVNEDDLESALIGDLKYLKELGKLSAEQEKYLNAKIDSARILILKYKDSNAIFDSIRMKRNELSKAEKNSDNSKINALNRDLESLKIAFIETEEKHPAPRPFLLSLTSGSIGYTSYRKGELQKAITFTSKAIKYDLLGANWREEISHRRNLSGIYLSINDFEKAFVQLDSCYTLATIHGSKLELAKTSLGLGTFFLKIGQKEDALKYFDKAYYLFSELGDEENLKIISHAYGLLGQRDALNYYLGELTEAQNQVDDRKIAIAKYHIADYYATQGIYKLALNYALVALEDYELIENQATSEVYILNNLIADVYYALQQYKNAVPYYIECVFIAEKLRKLDNEEDRKMYFSYQTNLYSNLASCYVNSNQIILAIETLEKSRTRVLAEKLATKSNDILSSFQFKLFQDDLKKEEAILYFSPINSVEKSVFLIKSNEVLHHKLNDSTFLYYSTNQELSENLKHITQFFYQTFQEKTDSTKILRTKAHLAFTLLYNIYLDEYAVGSRGADNLTQMDESENRKEDLISIEKLLYHAYLSPFEKNLTGITDLIIVPDGHLSFAPFEALIDPSKKYLAERFNISYANSLNILELLRNRQYSNLNKSIIAFGGANYSKGTKLEFGEGDDATRYQIQEDGFGNWIDIPGTITEVEGIKKAIPDSQVYQKDDVNESNIKTLSAEGKLKEYRVIHFATHGFFIDDKPEMSGIVLSLDRPITAQDDGYLLTTEIEALDIHAELVNLSACETGKGQIEAGDGIRGVAQSFVIAGANNLVVSLWKIADASTAQFMAGMYDLSENKGYSYAQAVTEMKRKFIRGDFGERYKAPYYWAPFIYYGLP